MSDTPFGRRALTVTANEQLGAYRLLHAEDPDGPQPQPGQFAMLACVERWGAGEDERPYLPRAFSIARHQNGQSQFLLEDVGPGTRRLCELQPGEALSVLGPLGRGFEVPADSRRALLVGGGVGIAPLAILEDSIRDRHSVTVLLGFRDRQRAAGAAILGQAQIATDDGSVGYHGLVTDLLESELERDPHAVVYACGPAGMLEEVRALCERTDTPAQLALEAGMACGYGACYGCVVATRDGYARVCVDGPVLDASLLGRVDAHAGAPA